MNKAPKKIIDMAGLQFGKWVAIGRAPARPGATEIFWLCRCTCGTERVVSGAALRRGRSTSCGHPEWQDVVAPELVPAGHRVCTSCRKPKPLTDFYGAHPWCKVCNRGAKNAAYAEGREKSGRKRRNAPVDGQKCCGSCGTWKILTEFQRTAIGGFAHCLTCTAAKGRARYAEMVAGDPTALAAHKRRCRGNHLKLKYDMTIDDYEAMYSAQGERCAICGLPGENLVVDHAHNTGKVRALLCQQCNFAVGAVRENAEIAKNVAGYIEKHLTQTGS